MREIPRDDVRGHLTLPAEGSFGTAVTWRSDKPRTIGTTGLVHRPAHGAGPETVKLTATLARGSARATKRFAATVRELPRERTYTGYAFSYFTGEGTANGEQIRMALSRGNGPLRWRELNGGAPVLSSGLGAKGLRDPFIIRSPEGDKFYQIATDLRMYGNGYWDQVRRTGRWKTRGSGAHQFERRQAPGTQHLTQERVPQWTATGPPSPGGPVGGGRGIDRG